TDRTARLEGLESGAEEFLTKPVERTELRLRVRNMLRIKAYNDLLKNHRTLLETEVKERTADLAASEERFREMAESIRDVFYLRDADGSRMPHVSPAYEEILGRRRETLYAAPESRGDANHSDHR